MIFTKFQSLTHKIDTMIIHDIKREMPLKYGLYRVAKWFAWLAHTGIFCTFIIYIGFSIITQHAGQEPRQPGGCKLKTAPVRPVVAARPAEYVCSEDLFY